MPKAIVLGGTKGLGREISKILLAQGITPLIMGRSVREAAEDSGLEGAHFFKLDLCRHSDLDRLRNQITDVSDFDYFFWVSGLGYQGSLIDQPWNQMEQIFDTVVVGPLNVLSWFLSRKEKPFTLVSVASTSSFTERHNETVYGAAKAAQAQATRNIRWEMPIGSRTLLIHPGGMDTGFWEGSDVDTSKFMDPAAVAKIIWDKIVLHGSKREDLVEREFLEPGEVDQDPEFAEYKIARVKNGEPIVSQVKVSVD